MPHELEVRQQSPDPTVLVRMFVDTDGNYLADAPEPQIWVEGWQIPPGMRIRVAEEAPDARHSALFIRNQDPQPYYVISAEVKTRSWSIENVPWRPHAEPIEMDEGSFPGMHISFSAIEDEVMSAVAAWPVTEDGTRRLIRTVLTLAGMHDADRL